MTDNNRMLMQIGFDYLNGQKGRWSFDFKLTGGQWTHSRLRYSNQEFAASRMDNFISTLAEHGETVKAKLVFVPIL